MKRPLVVHIIYKLDVGGLENGIVNLINNMSPEQFNHIIVCITHYTEFRNRIKRGNVVCYNLGKREGKDLKMFVRLWWLLLKLRPDIVHTRNMAALECQLSAMMAGVRLRVHGEHGWDMENLKGDNQKHRIIRKVFRFFVMRYICVSRHIADYLSEQIGVPKHKMVQIYNGVDTSIFKPQDQRQQRRLMKEFVPANTLLIGTVGRMQQVKDQITLLRSFQCLLEMVSETQKEKLRLVLVGDGPLRKKIEQMIEQANIADIVLLIGERNDVAELLGALDIFVLPSLAEGISNTILEAMASGLPIVATQVGGNSELIIEGQTGMLVPANDPQAMATALHRYVNDRSLRFRHGEAARQRAVKVFGMNKMVTMYSTVYESLLGSKS